ncbi:General substrate transporter [Metarhizium album ARSEF 1941]|uniref:General substrate transporter n=1 Tax=Metarhizium album (strain ARSEF 1941) TaxID=1081103 RepID=A0A0B2X4H0_METAS|nr:General substrate transporter [Metarhizium album ARSEF 1941]KHO00653.1 General substrate transporter [Metarhizium album ARSEF 1941]
MTPHSSESSREADSSTALSSEDQDCTGNDNNKTMKVAQFVVEPDNDIFRGNIAAKAANDHEQTMSTKYALKYYSIAMAWAAVMAAPIIMEAYETAMVPTFFSYRAFQCKYGLRNDETGDCYIPTGWQSGITMAASSGQLAGLYMAPHIVNRMGYRICSVAGFISAALCLMIGFWSMDTDRALAVFLIGEMLLGVPWGMFQGITLPYVSDITPLKLKGPATTMINVFWLVGQMASAGVVSGASAMSSREWSIKTPMIIQYAWLVPLVALVLMAPDSPFYLSRNGQDGQARATLRRLNKDPVFDADGALAMISAINRHEEKTSTDMGLTECFRGINLRRTEIAVISYVTQQWVGTPLMFYSVKVLQKGGLSQASSLRLTIGMYALCIVSTVASMGAMRFWGRRNLWLGGLAGEITCLSIIGTLSFFLGEDDGKKTGVPWAIAAFLILYAAIYNFTIGPLCYTIVAEMPATRLKAATNSLSRFIYLIFAMTNLYLVPNLLEGAPVGWGLGTRAALVWAGSATACLIWAFFRLPETKDRTPAEVDVLFERKVRARNWSRAVVV